MDIFSMQEVVWEGEKFDCFILVVDRHSEFTLVEPAKMKGLKSSKVAQEIIPRRIHTRTITKQMEKQNAQEKKSKPGSQDFVKDTETGWTTCHMCTNCIMTRHVYLVYPLIKLYTAESDTTRACHTKESERRQRRYGSRNTRTCESGSKRHYSRSKTKELPRPTKFEHYQRSSE